MTRWWLLLWLLVGVPFAQAAADNAARYREAWQQPPTLALPKPLRAIQLPSVSAATDLAARAGLSGHRITALADGALLETPLDAQQWQQFQGQHCAGGSTVQCLLSQCQSIAQASAQQTNSAPVARLVRSSEAVVLTSAQLARMADSRCEAPLPVLADPAGQSPGRNFSLNLDLRDLGEGSRSAAPAPAVSVQLDTDALPADTSGYAVDVAAGCASSTTPLDSLQPAQVPGVVLALVADGASAAVASRHGLTALSQHRLQASGQTLVVYAAAQRSLTEMAVLRAAMLADPEVEATQPEFIYRTAGAARAAQSASDPLAGLTYAPVQLGARVLHERLQGRGQQIAIIDTGVDVNHPDLAGRVTETHDTTGAGFAAEGHGTAVAGVMAAGVNNAIGGYGVAPEVGLLAIKACEPLSEGGFSARCRTSTLLQALDIATTKAVPIINMSLTGPPDALLADAIERAVAAGALVIAAAGNGGVNARPAFPAALPGVLAVTALDAAQRRYPDANLGGYIDLAAPGVDLVTTAPGGAHPSVSGTSFAAAAVSGVAALLREHQPGISAAALIRAMTAAAADLGPEGQDDAFGRGLLSACRAADLDCEAIAR